MGAPQNSIDAQVGSAINLLPMLVYPNGTYNPTPSTYAGAFDGGLGSSHEGSGIVDVSDYRGVIMQCLVSKPTGSSTPAVQIIPHHGPCPDFVTHDPFGTGWGFHINGQAAGSPGSSVLRNVFIDTRKTMSHLSVEVTVAGTAAGCLLGVALIPIGPKGARSVIDFDSDDVLDLFSSGELDFSNIPAIA